MRCAFALLTCITLTSGCSPTRPYELDRFDPRRPYRLLLDRYSGQDALDTIELEEDGTVILYRRVQVRDDSWEAAELKLPREACAKLAALVDQDRLLTLEHLYDPSPAMHGGTEWEFLLEQAGKQKTVYSNNEFPKELVHFAKALDKLLAEHGLAKVRWHRVSAEEVSKHRDKLSAALALSAQNGGPGAFQVSLGLTATFSYFLAWWWAVRLLVGRRHRLAAFALLAAFGCLVGGLVGEVPLVYRSAWWPWVVVWAFYALPFVVLMLYGIRKWRARRRACSGGEEVRREA